MFYEFILTIIFILYLYLAFFTPLFLSFAFPIVRLNKLSQLSKTNKVEFKKIIIHTLFPFVVFSSYAYFFLFREKIMSLSISPITFSICLLIIWMFSNKKQHPKCKPFITYALKGVSSFAVLVCYTIALYYLSITIPKAITIDKDLLDEIDIEAMEDYYNIDLPLNIEGDYILLGGGTWEEPYSDLIFEMSKTEWSIYKEKLDNDLKNDNYSFKDSKNNKNNVIVQIAGNEESEYSGIIYSLAYDATYLEYMIHYISQK